jgi:YHS domain-containing protein
MHPLTIYRLTPFAYSINAPKYLDLSSIMKTNQISFLAGFIAAIAVPVFVNAAGSPRSLLSNPTEIAKDKGVVLAEKTVQSDQKAKVNVDSNGVILKGYDPVAYFTQHRPVKGKPTIKSSFGGAIYHFTSAADKAAFDKNPSGFVPQYGAFCANYVRKGELRDVDPTVFFIYRGKLYVCSAADEAKEFRSNVDENIDTADRNWRQLTGS